MNSETIKKLVLLAFILIPMLTFAQKINRKTTDPKKNNEMLVGYCNREGFASINSNFDSVYKANYQAYNMDEPTMKLLAAKLKGVKVTVVMATWCGDSKEWVPRFYRILDELNYKSKNITLISVDRTKKAPGTGIESLDIQLVPTFIFYRKKTEVGRIIEVPAGLLEKNMLEILTR